MRTRRQFLAGAALAAAHAPTARGAKPDFRFPAEPKDRLAVASYSFRSLIDTPKNRTRLPAIQLITLKHFASVMATKYEIHAVELLGQHFPSREPEYLRELRDAVKASGSRIVNIPTGVGASVYAPDTATRALAVENGKKWIDTAVAVDCPSVRIHLQGPTPEVKLAADSLRAIASYGESHGVVVNLENDDPTTEDATFITRVIDEGDHPWLRALPDFCNSMLKGDEKSNYEAVTAMFRRAYNICHVKDSEVDGAKTYRVDLARTFAIAKQSGYRGYFSVEWEGAGDVWVENAKLIEQSIRILQQ